MCGGREANQLFEQTTLGVRSIQVQSRLAALHVFAILVLLLTVRYLLPPGLALGVVSSVLVLVWRLTWITCTCSLSRRPRPRSSFNRPAPIARTGGAIRQRFFATSTTAVVASISDSSWFH